MECNSIDIASRRQLNFVSDYFDETNKEIVDLDNDGGDNLTSKHHSSNLEEKTPKIGMEFDTDEVAYKFYKEYSKVAGFGVRKHGVHKDISGKVLDRTFCCACQGYRGKDKRDEDVVKHRPETRTGCGAMMKIDGRISGKYKVVSFISKHSGHELVSPSKTHLLRSHRSITSAQAYQADDIDYSGIAPKAGFQLMVQQVGGREKVGFTLEDYKNYLRSKRTIQMKIGDTGGVLEYLKQRQLDDPNFFYAIQIDEDGLIANIFWADSQMMTDYGHFGDVVCFDTTYRKNKEGRPFALFVGVNHHKQTILFGAALLYDETALTFMWLFDTFAKTMSGKQPETILTDQDQAMAKALAEKWPNTHHRLCIWHIYQNAAIHLSNVFAQFKSFARDFSSCIYDFDEEEEFLSAWQVMLEKYGLESNEWLERMFKIRQKWALVYGRQSFCADMTTTQRSESMNSVLKRYVSYKHNLLQFFQHFDRLIEDRRYEEVKADLKTSHSTPVAAFPVEIAKHAASIYTHEVFESFQDELRKAYDSKIELCSEIGDICEYKVIPFRRNYQHTVFYDSSKIRVSCSCKKFEFGGILCSHSLKVLSSRNIVNIPDVYIKKRWTKKAKKHVIGAQSSFNIPSDLVSENEERKMVGAHYKELCILHNQLSKIAALTVESFSIAKNNVLKTFEEVYASLENVKTTRPSIGAKSVIQKEHLLNNIGDLGKEVGDVSNTLEVRGWKNKEKKPIRSGRRPKSGLERSTRNKKRRQKSPLVTNEHDIIGNNQTNEIGGSNLSVAYDTEGPFLLGVEAFQIGQQIVQEPYDFTACYSGNQQQSRQSLTQLLQQQEVGQLGPKRGFN